TCGAPYRGAVGPATCGINADGATGTPARSRHSAQIRSPSPLVRSYASLETVRSCQSRGCATQALRGKNVGWTRRMQPIFAGPVVGLCLILVRILAKRSSSSPSVSQPLPWPKHSHASHEGKELHLAK